MPRLCSVCLHLEREAIDKQLVAGLSYRNLSARYGLSSQALIRHRNEHLPETLVRAYEASEAARAENLLAQLAELRADARRIGQRAEEAEDYRTALAGIRELVRILELTAKITGELDERPQVLLVQSPEWGALRARIVTALAAFPQARLALVEALEEDGHAIG